MVVDGGKMQQAQASRQAGKQASGRCKGTHKITVVLTPCSSKSRKSKTSGREIKKRQIGRRNLLVLRYRDPEEWKRMCGRRRSL